MHTVLQVENQGIGRLTETFGDIDRQVDRHRQTYRYQEDEGVAIDVGREVDRQSGRQTQTNRPSCGYTEVER